LWVVGYRIENSAITTHSAFHWNPGVVVGIT
jgi:hypothetical protein